jgi:hypothetical protein
MINRTDIIQQSVEWHEVKHGKVGGTLSKGLFTKGDTLFLHILSQRIEPFDADEIEDGFESKAMQRGNDLEPLAVQYVEEYTGIKFNSTGWLQCEENELLGISPDAISECLKISIEAKCPGAKEHTETIYKNEIPLKHINQIVHSFIVNKQQEKLIFISFRPESPKHFIKEVALDTMVNLGTQARPVMKTVEEWRDLGRAKADKLLNDLKKAELKINF